MAKPEEYNHKEIEGKWQKIWEEKGIFNASNDSQKPKYYVLVEFPYPSGDGLHVGHPRSYVALDLLARKRRMEGFNVLYPIGWDAFGLPAESYAVKTGVHPKITTKQNIDNFRKQIKSLGISFDWSREINTTDPNYYRWTQWLFLQFLKHDLAYKEKMPINWCPKDKIGLANEEVVDGKCERCGTPVEKREKEQWMLAITKYAERLDADLETVNYLPRIKLQQKNWIGKSEGAEVDFELTTRNLQLKTIKVFTTRPDTIFGATYMVVAPEHELVTKLLENNELRIENKKEIQKYIEKARKKTEIERTAEGKEKTGVEIKGIKAINPATKEEIPIWVADYVLSGYGTGAIMAVPADDERDREFAEKFDLPIVEEYKPAGFEDFGKKITKYKLRDWIFSRQRYWGEPIPVIHCEECGIVPVPEEDLPVVLPDIENFLPTDDGDSPLAKVSDWVNTKCPKCGGDGKRETDVMPNWAGSSWYFLRYTDPNNEKAFADKDILNYWTPVDWYNGGMEHTTLHLLYSRFWHKFFYDIGLVPTPEPYMKRTSHGLILGEGGEKMSKSRGNVVNPDEIVEIYGADTMRLYEMFIGPFDQHASWSMESIIGPRRFLERVWRLQTKISEKETDKTALSAIHKAIDKVSGDIESMSFNTAVSALMVCVNEMEKASSINKKDFEMFLAILSPFAPHLSEELWESLGNKDSIAFTSWPKVDPRLLVDDVVTIAVQVNGRVRATFTQERDSSEEETVKKAKELPEIEKWVGDNEPKKVIFVKNKLVNIVV